MVCKHTQPQRIINEPFVNGTLNRSKLYLITTILKNSLDTIRLLRAVATYIKKITFLQILFERGSHQIEILMKDRLGGCTERDTGFRRSGWLVTKFQPTEIKSAYSKLTAIDQFSLQRNSPILFGLLNGYCLRSQRLIMHHLDSLAQPKKVTHGEHGFFRNKIQKRSGYLSRHCQIRNDRHFLFLLTGQLRLHLKGTDTLYFITEKVNTIRIFRSKRENIDYTATNGILSRLIYIIHIFKTITMQHIRYKSSIHLFTHTQFQGLIAQFLTGYHFLSQRIGISDDTQTFLSFLQTAQHLRTQNLIGCVFLSVLDGTPERRRKKKHRFRA